MMAVRNNSMLQCLRHLLPVQHNSQLRLRLTADLSHMVQALLNQGSVSIHRQFTGVVASQMQHPPIVSFLCSGLDPVSDSDAPLPSTLLSCLAQQSSQCWELLIVSDREQVNYRLQQWVQLLREAVSVPVRIVNASDPHKSWPSLLAWSSGRYLMPVTPNTWLDPDLVLCLASRWNHGVDDAALPALVTLDALRHHSDEPSGAGIVDQICLGNQHDRWSLASGWSPLPYMLCRRWVLECHGLDAPDLVDPVPWHQELLARNQLPCHFPGLFASATPDWRAIPAATVPSRSKLLPAYSAVIVASSWSESPAQAPTSLLHLVQSMLASSHPPAEILIVDVDLAASVSDFEHLGMVRLIPKSAASPCSAGLMSSASLGIEAASEELIVVISEHVEADDQWTYQRLLEPYAQSFAGIAAPRLLDPESRILHRGIMGGIMGAFGRPGLGASAESGSPEEVRAAERRLVCMVSTAVLVIPREIWIEVGGVNSDLTHDEQMLDICLRAGLLGHEVLYNGPAVYRLSHSATSSAAIEDRNSHRAFLRIWSQALEDDCFRHPLRSRSSLQDEASTVCRSWLSRSWRRGHWLLIPVYEWPDQPCLSRWMQWRMQGFNILLIDNHPGACLELADPLSSLVMIVRNANHSLLAGGINAGMQALQHYSVDAVTILDQDSLISCESLDDLRSRLMSSHQTIWGPTIYDLHRHLIHAAPSLRAEWFLMSSGTTLRMGDWLVVGAYQACMEIDYLDHEWSARAVAKGYRLACSPSALLAQRFGSSHPHPLARRLGMNLYSPVRHQAAIRNLLWLLRVSWLPSSFKLKEGVKMLLKPWCWLAFEPNRHANLKAILTGLRRGLFANPLL